MNDKQRLREIEEVLTVVLQEQERLKDEVRRLRAERDRAEEQISKLEQTTNVQQQEAGSFTSFSAPESMQPLQAEHLLFLLTQPQTQN